MQLDKTRIVIREREQIESLDLALRVIRVFAGPLSWALAAGVVPTMLLNAWLLSGYADLTTQTDFDAGMPLTYLMLMGLLVAFETPLVTAPMTVYLGQAVFRQRPDARSVAADLRAALPQLVFYQVLLRVFHLTWPFLNEVILLERNPIRAAAKGQRTTRSRAANLHRGQAGDVIGRMILLTLVAVPLFVAVLASIFLLRVFLLNQWDWEFDMTMYTLYFPLTLWLVIGFLNVVRFLGYLDLRIRHEGWEVELMMRAEAGRLAREPK